jgi:sterol desaturase/sphingolipid hydroxylase (fatty acid hydroxylase superfamily)
MLDSSLWRGAAVLISLLLLVVWEHRRPLVRPPARRLAHWWRHLGLLVVGLALVRIVVPGGLIAIALSAQSHQVGLLTETPLGWRVALSLLLLDLAIYLQHAALHWLPWLWRLHRIHHSETHLDASSAWRFHPFELLLSFAWKALWIVLLGAPWQAVLVFELLLGLSALWSHSNIALPPRLERVIGALWITPTQHRWHHAPDTQAQQFGNGLMLWDRLFGTLPAQAHAPAPAPGPALGERQDRGQLRDWLIDPWR